MFKTDGFEPSAYPFPPRAQYCIQLLIFRVVIAIAAFYYSPFLFIFACKILSLQTDLNCHRLLTRQLYYHCTMKA